MPDGQSPFSEPANAGYGFAIGADTLDALSDVGVSLAGWRWQYRTGEDRDNPFPPHVALAGTYHLTLPTAEGWYPSDHLGCKCAAVPSLRGPDGRYVAFERSDDIED